MGQIVPAKHHASPATLGGNELNEFVGLYLGKITDAAVSRAP